MDRPRLIPVDVRLITFNPRNPNHHYGRKFAQLKRTILETGVVQPPVVRDRPGGMYECISGEGRVKAAIELGKEQIDVISYGVVDDDVADTMMHVVNAVFNFDLLQDCIGIATLHRGGMSYRQIGQKLGESSVSLLIDKGAIGYWPEDVLKMIQDDIEISEDRAKLWTMSFLNELTRLRRLVEGQDPAHAETLDGVYDYTDIRAAVQLVIKGEITSRPDEIAYVERTLRERSESLLNQELQRQVQEELARTRAALETAYQQQVEGIEQQVAAKYGEQIQQLETTKTQLEGRVQALAGDLTKRPAALAELEEDLRSQVAATREERQRLQAMEQQMARETQQARATAQSEVQTTLTRLQEELRAQADDQITQARKQLEATFQERDEQRQLQAERTMGQVLARGGELAAQLRQWLHHVTAPGMLPGMAMLPRERDALLMDLAATLEVIQTASEKITRGQDVETIDVIPA